MSAKQVSKLRQLRQQEEQGGRALPEEAKVDEEKTEDEEDEGPIAVSGQRKAPGFAALAGVLSSSSESDSDEPPAEEKTPTPTPTPVSGRARPARRRCRAGGESSGGNRCAQRDSEEAALLEWEVELAQEDIGTELTESTEPTEANFEAGYLALRRADYSQEAERRRATGRSRGKAPGAVRARGQAEGRTVHHRRLFLVTPTAEEPWPRPDDTMVMIARTDGFGAAVFDFEESATSARSLQALKSLLRNQDPQLIQNWLQHQSPFSVDGLLVLAEHHRGQAAHEQSLQLVRRAVYALECAFCADFAPFQATGVGPGALRPRVRLQINDSPEWPGWSWLRAMRLHMQGLAGQGLHRTALEVCKLLMAASLPRDPVRSLLFCDYLCLRSRQFDALAGIAYHLAPKYGLARSAVGVQERLDLAMPNFAYSVALAAYLKAGNLDLALLSEVCLADVMPRGSAPRAAAEDNSDDPGALPTGAAAHARLMRAMLVFPLALRPLLEEVGAKMHLAPGGSPSRETWADLFSKPPFADAASFRHETHSGAHGRICGAYAKRCGSLWKADLVQSWLHACAARLASMHESPLFASELAAARAAWASAPLCVDTALAADFADLLPEEGAAENPICPAVLERALQARLHPPHAEQGMMGEGAAGGFGGGGFGGGGFVAGRAAIMPPTISLHSPPLLVFFQSILPWGEVDRSGVSVEPLFWRDVALGAAGNAQSAVLFLLGAVADLWRLLAAAVGPLLRRQ